MNQPKSVYISGPYTKGNVNENVRVAIEAAETLTNCGINLIPFIPHLTHFWDFIRPHSWDFWLGLDLYWLRKCDYVLRLPGESKGADIEVKHAVELGLRVFNSIGDLLEYINAQKSNIENPGHEYWFANAARLERYTDIVLGIVSAEDLKTPEEFELYLSLGKVSPEWIEQMVIENTKKAFVEKYRELHEDHPID